MRKLLHLFIAIMLSSAVQAQSLSNYTFSTSTDQSFTDMTGSTTLIPGGSNPASTAFLPVPSDFLFFMPGITNRAGFWLVTPNFINFQGSNTSNPPIFSNTNVRISGMSHTANSNTTAVNPGGKIHYLVTGTAPNRVLTVEYLDIRFSQVGATSSVTYQVKLYEGTSVVEIVYGANSYNDASTILAHIGVGGGAVAGNFISVDPATHTASTNVITRANITETSIGALNTPTDGSRRMYRFTPPARPNAPLAVAQQSANSGSITYAITQAATNPGYRYLVYFSQDAAGPFTFSTIATSTTFTLSSLLANTTYYVRVFALGEGAVSTQSVDAAGATTAPATIRSTAVGGNWNTASTWVGGAVPSSNDNVIIEQNAIVNLTASTAIGPLVVNGTLEIEGTSITTLSIGGDVTNNGTITTKGDVPQPNLLRSLAVLDGNIVNNGSMFFGFQGATINMAIPSNETRNFTNNGTIDGTDASANPANTPIISRIILNGFNINSGQPGGNLQLNFPVVIRQQLNMAYGKLRTTGQIYFDNTLFVAGGTPSTEITVGRSGDVNQTGITQGNVIFGPTATYNLQYNQQTGQNPMMVGPGIEFPPAGFVINNLTINHTDVSFPAFRSVQVRNSLILGNTTRLLLGSGDLILGTPSAPIVSLAGTNIFTTGAIRRWVQPNTTITNLSFPQSVLSNNGQPQFREFGITANANAITAPGLISVQHFNVAGQTNFVSPFFDNNYGYVKRSNSYWTVTTSNGIAVDGDLVLRFNTEGLPNTETPPFVRSNVVLENGIAPGTFETPLQGTGIETGATPAVIRRRISNVADLNNSFYLGESDPLLPLQLLNFSGRAQQATALLQWRTQNEVNVSHFDVERSATASNWQAIGKVLANGGSFAHAYTFTDAKMPAGNNFYRLKMTDKDGTFTYSPVVQLVNNASGTFTLQPAYPNPSRGMINVRYELPQQANVSILLTDLLGRTITLGNYPKQAPGMYNQQFNLKGMQQGTGRYLLRLVATDGNGNLLYQQHNTLVLQ